MDLSEKIRQKIIKFFLILSLSAASNLYFRAVGSPQSSPCQPAGVPAGLVKQIEIISINGQPRLLAVEVFENQVLPSLPYEVALW